MTLTPDRQNHGNGDRARMSPAGKRGPASKRPGSSGPSSSGPGSSAGGSSRSTGAPESLFDQLRDAGLDLTGSVHAELFEEIPAVPEAESPASPETSIAEASIQETPVEGAPIDGNPVGEVQSDATPAGEAPGAEEPDDSPGVDDPDDYGHRRSAALAADVSALSVDEDPTGPGPIDDDDPAAAVADIVDSGNSTSDSGNATSDSRNAMPISRSSVTDSTRSMPDTRKLSRHPLLTDAAWSRLSEFAPEVLDSITNLTRLESEVRTFERPVGPDDAVILADALEAINRVNASLNAVTLAIFQRVGVPTDFGAKTTKALVKDRLGLSDQEAYRRTEAANNLGGRVDLSGQPMPPLAPKAADGLHEGVLSANQAAVIAECMKRLPAWVSAELRAETEERLVKEAPNVRVSDLREIFQRMLDIIDPDGKEPSEGRDRSDYSVHLRARRNGDWELSGRLDPITGGLLNGLLTSRIESCRTTGEQGGADAPGGQGDAGRNGDPASHGDASQGGDATGNGDAGRDGVGSGLVSSGFPGTEAAGEESPSAFDVLDAVLSGDRHDAPLFAQDGTGQRLPGTGTSADASDGTPGATGYDGSAYGVRRDGTTVSTVDAQPSARRWIYERFASLIGKIEMNRPNSGARYSLVVTAKAEDLASNTGQGKTGTENPVPMSELTSSGLNGRVFFHLMSDSAKTVQVATEKRFADEKQTAIITARDMGCTFPGCDAPPGWCEVHHIVPWIDNGITDINNLTLACGAHHHLIDRSDWHSVMLTSGQPAWVPPASIDPERRPILHAKFVAQGIIDTLFDS